MRIELQAENALLAAVVVRLILHHLFQYLMSILEGVSASLDLLFNL
jgi:hypothetical protein